MATRRTLSISISPDLLSFAERLLASGRYGNLSEVVRTALRQMEERELDFQAHRDKRVVDLPSQTEPRPGGQDLVASNV